MQEDRLHEVQDHHLLKIQEDHIEIQEDHLREIQEEHRLEIQEDQPQ